MSGVVVVVPTGPAPVLQVTVTAGTVPAGARMVVRGRARGYSWPVRCGSATSTGEQLVLTDALAPVNVPVSYEVAWDGGLVVSTPVVRPWAGRSLMTDTLGGSQVDLVWQGDDPRTSDQRVTLHTVVGRATPVAVLAPVMGAGTVSLTARTDPAGTTALVALVARGVPVALLHNPRRCYQCRRGACDVPLVTVVVLTDVSRARTARPDAAERAWSLRGAVVAVPEQGLLVAVSSWDDLDARGLTWDQVEAMGLTWDELDRVLWGEVGP